jgi:hypothetical protein
MIDWTKFMEMAVQAFNECRYMKNIVYLMLYDAKWLERNERITQD